MIKALCQNDCGIIELDMTWEELFKSKNDHLPCPKCGEDLCWGDCCIPENVKYYEVK